LALLEERGTPRPRPPCPPRPPFPHRQRGTGPDGTVRFPRPRPTAGAHAGHLVKRTGDEAVDRNTGRPRLLPSGGVTQELDEGDEVLLDRDGRLLLGRLVLDLRGEARMVSASEQHLFCAQFYNLHCGKIFSESNSDSTIAGSSLPNSSLRRR